MRIIGITGGIGSGKSTVLNILDKEYGAYIVETDKLAHKLMCPGQIAYKQIVEMFGTEILQHDKRIHRGRLGELVFHNKEKLQQLNAIVHPAVKDYILKDIVTKQSEGKITFYVIEAALLIEDGYKLICDELWYVYATEEVRLQRLLEGRGGTSEKWLQVIENQSSEAFYRMNCDEVIDNSGSIAQTALNMKELLSK